jgi:hypothetical protein
MSLTIGIAVNPSRFDIDHAHTVQFEDDAYYWFLYPAFVKLFEATGKFISLHGNACFEGESLVPLRAALEQAKQMALLLPEKWTVHDGSYDPEKVRRETLLTLLDNFARLVAEAIDSQSRLLCLGELH